MAMFPDIPSTFENESNELIKSLKNCLSAAEEERVRLAVRLQGAMLEAEGNRALLETILAAQNDAVLIYDHQMNVLRANPSFIATYGFDPTGLNVKDIVQRVSCRWLDGRPFVWEDQPTPRALRGEKVTGARYLVMRADGAEAAVETSSGPMRQGEDIKGTVTVWHDITAQVRMEQALRQSEERYRSMFNAMTEGFALHEIILDENGAPCDYRFLDINPAFEWLTGLKREEVVGKRMYEVLPENDPYWVKIFGEVALSGQPAHFENYSSPLEQHYDVFAYCPKPGQLAVIFTNITERKEREERLHRYNRTLKALSRSSQAMMRAENEADYLQEVCKIVTEDCGHAMVWIGFAEHDEAKSVRPVVYAGFEEGYLATLKLTWADTPRGRGPTGTAIRTGKPSMCRNMLTDPNFAPWREQALKRGYASSIVLPLIAEGKTFGALTIYSEKADAFLDHEVGLLTELANDLAHGITTLRLLAARAQAEEALRVANAHLEQRVSERTAELQRSAQELEVINEELRLEMEENLRINQALLESEGKLRQALNDEQSMRSQLIQSEKYAALARMVASVAHELNNPIQTIQNCMYLLKTRVEVGSGDLEFMEMASSETERIARLVQQLRETYRPANSYAPEIFNVMELLQGVQNILEPHLKQNRTTMSIHALKEGILLNGIVDQIKQVFLNISLNAIEAMQPEGGSLKVYVSRSERRNKATIAFVDSGPGIPKENISKIFEPFFTTKTKGTGLGLSICYEIVQNHGGKITVHSRPGDGQAGEHRTTFTVWLPAGGKAEG